MESFFLLIWSLLFNTLTADYEYCRSNGGNLLLTIQVQLFKKVKKKLEPFIVFLESTSNFEHFEK